MTYEEFESECLADASVIYVRRFGDDDRWHTVALSEIPINAARVFIRRWYLEGRKPLRTVLS